jgi:hypothetical protein
VAVAQSVPPEDEPEPPELDEQAASTRVSAATTPVSTCVRVALNFTVSLEWVGERV